VTKAAKTEFRWMKRKRFIRNSSIGERLKQPVWKEHIQTFTRKRFSRTKRFWGNTLKIAADETTD
jgi:hypothetical protein